MKLRNLKIRDTLETDDRNKWFDPSNTNQTKLSSQFAQSKQGNTMSKLVI